MPLIVRAGAARACGRLDAHQVLRGRFEQTRRLQGFTRPLITQGHFVLAPGIGLIWQAETPFAVTTVMSAAGLVQEMRGTETFRMTSDRVPFLARLHDMLAGALAGDWSRLDADFSVAHSGDAAAWQTTLTPRSSPTAVLPFQSIIVRGGCLVDLVELLKPGGDTDMLRFLDQAVVSGPLTTAEQGMLAVLAR